jgi:hypothetical protein
LLLYFWQVWLQSLSKVLESQSSRYLLLCPSCHLGSVQLLNSLSVIPPFSISVDPVIEQLGLLEGSCCLFMFLVSLSWNKTHSSFIQGS